MFLKNTTLHTCLPVATMLKCCFANPNIVNASNTAEEVLIDYNCYSNATIISNVSNLWKCYLQLGTLVGRCRSNLHKASHKNLVAIIGQADPNLKKYVFIVGFKLVISTLWVVLKQLWVWSSIQVWWPVAINRRSIIVAFEVSLFTSFKNSTGAHIHPR